MNKNQLWDSMVNGVSIVVWDSATRVFSRGIVRTIQAEDGSGSSFNVTLHTGKTVYVRTID